MDNGFDAVQCATKIWQLKSSLLLVIQNDRKKISGLSVKRFHITKRVCRLSFPNLVINVKCLDAESVTKSVKQYGPIKPKETKFKAKATKKN